MSLSPGQIATAKAYGYLNPSRLRRVRRQRMPTTVVDPQGFKLEDVLSDFVRMMKAADVIDGKQQDKMLRYIRSSEVKAIPTGQWSKKDR